MATSFYGGNFFGGEFFNLGGGEDPRPRPGDKGRKKKGIYKPTGLPAYREIPEGRKTVDDRVAEAARIASEVASQVSRDFSAKTRAKVARSVIEAEQKALEELRARTGYLQVEIERLKQGQEDEELLVLLMIAAASVN